MNDKLIIIEAIASHSPLTALSLNSQEIESAFVVSYTEKNTTDLHFDVRKASGLNKTSHKTHIDVTSGGDIGKGLCPVENFFIVNNGIVKIPVLVHGENIAKISGRKQINADWYADTVKVYKLEPRNISKNPSIQLLEKNDLELIRSNQKVGDCLIFLKKNDGEILAVGASRTVDLDQIMAAKSKRMFGFMVPTNRPAIIESDEDGSRKTSLNSNRLAGKNSIGRGSNPSLNKAIEECGVAVSIKFLTDNHYLVSDVSTPELAISHGLEKYPGFDQLATKNGKSLGVEVKATTLPGHQVHISSNELSAAISNNDWRLLVVSDIKIDDRSASKVSGGNPRIFKVSDNKNLKKCLEKLNEAIALAEVSGLIATPSYSVSLQSNLFTVETLD
ncbi:hypothetical protein OAI46_00870 [Alphaproteobacteria bacterium]|nr:hypothetical protein [Alphaproteobacteria bacterium]